MSKNIENKLETILPRVKKPGRYIGNEWNSIRKEWTNDRVSIALCFPDTYEIGMSHLGLNLLYDILNKREWILAERAYTPWIDMENELRKNNLPLFSLESKAPLYNFDVIAFTLQYELTYTNILNILNLGQIPIKKKDRINKKSPLIIAGGPNAFMPEPLADFIDAFVIGEGEDVVLEIMKNVYARKMESTVYNDYFLRSELLKELKKIEGIYIPEYYITHYDNKGYYLGIEPSKDNLHGKIKKRVTRDFDVTEKLESPIVPNIEIVHDRAAVELFRGCGKGCRFCQAGMVYRPLRERSISDIIEQAERLLRKTGYEELSLTSLSSADYSKIEELIDELNYRFSRENISLSLPSLRIDSFSIELLKKLQKVKKPGLTFAPEAGSERLRNVINKKVSEEDLLNACRAAFESGWHTIKLYFMLGLPTETYYDLDCIVDLVYKVVELYKKINNNLKRFKLNVSTSVYVPKPHTPFQWLGQIDKQEIIAKQNYLRDKLRHKVVNYSWDDPDKSFLEAYLAKGDRRCGQTILQAYLNGARLDGWGETFDIKAWELAFEKSEVAPKDVVNKDRVFNEPLPWEHIDSGLSRDFLIKEYNKAIDEATTSNCKALSKSCDVCGVCQRVIFD